MSGLARLATYFGLTALGVVASCAVSTDESTSNVVDTGEECQPEVCDGLDNDCNGLVDEGCACAPGEQQDCYTGPPVTADRGVCRPGTQTCSADGTWGGCQGEVTPADEACDKLDNNCDGTVDNDCTPGILLANGDRCAADADCDSGNCECEDFACEVRFCTADDCLCGYGTSGSCDEALTGQQDPEDCDGADQACGVIDECNSP